MPCGYTEKSFAMNIILMQVLGLYPVNKYRKLHRYYGRILYLVVLVPFPILGAVYLYLKKNIDILEMSYNGFIVVDTACFIVKYIPFLRNPEKIRKCVQYLDSIKFLDMKDAHKSIREQCVRICQRNTNVFVCGCFISMFICAFKPIFSEHQILPIGVWLPFNILNNRTRYYLVYIHMCMGVFYSGCSTGPVDPLIGGLACHASGQLKVLKDNLQHLNTYAREEHKKNSRKYDKDKIMYNMIKKCIEHHRAIYTFYKEYEECFSLAVFSQFVASSITFGFCCLYLSKFPFLSINFVIMMLYFYVMVFQIYFYCYYGTTLIEESNSLNTAVYMGNWYEYNLEAQKALIILMENSKKPMIITAAKILDLSLDTFAMIMKRSYSVLALLKNY